MISERDFPLEAVDAAASEVGPEPGLFRFTRTGSTAFALGVNYTLAGTATNNGDYSFISTNFISIPAGQASVDRQISPLNDALVEGSETVIITVSEDPQYNLGAPGSETATVTIADDDGP